MSEPTKWNPGIANTAWKVMVCARDSARAEDLIHGVAYILDQTPRRISLESDAEVIGKFTGAQIADALLAYRASAHMSVIKGMSNFAEDECK